MDFPGVSATVQRRSVAALGGLLGLVVAGSVFATRGRPAALHVVEVGIPFLLAVVLVLFGIWLVRSDLSPGQIARIATWAVVGTVVLGAFATWEMYVHFMEGETLVDTTHELLLGMSEGATIGGLLGYYDARRAEQYREAERARQAIAASMDGMAILDGDGEYLTVNQAHAEVYGYDDPEAFVGETWHVCYTDEEVRRVEEEVFAELEAEGYWRGEPTGMRRDGSTFPQELTLSTRPSGGLICVVRDVTERHERERGIRLLHEATREMMQETDAEAISRIAAETAQDVLDLPLSAIWLQPDDEDRLEPVAWSRQAKELFDEMPVFEPGDSLSWQAYEEGEHRVFDDVRTADDRVNPETQVRSELIVPIGEYGVLNSGTTTVGEFEETDVVLAQLLAANVESALERAEREVTLQRQTDQMEFFNSILRHDVLNGMTVIRGRAELLSEDLEGDHRRDAETILEWSDDVVTVVQRVRRVLESLTGTGDPWLRSVDLESVLREEVDRVRSTYPEVTVETDVPGGVTVRANELLGEVLGNVVTNAIEHNDTEGLRITVTVEEPAGSDTVTVRIADNGQGIPDDRKTEVFRRDSTGHVKSTGSGFGLFFVDSMVGEYGGEVWIEDNDPEGTVFVVELPTP